MKIRKHKNQIRTEENYLIAYIIRGNRQAIKVLVKASRRFKVGLDTYIIKSDCIFTKIIDGKLASVSYYSEGNPNPYNFEQKVNDGLTYAEFDVIYGEDLYDILVKIQSDKKMFYLLLLNVFVFTIAIITLISAIFH